MGTTIRLQSPVLPLRRVAGQHFLPGDVRTAVEAFAEPAMWAFLNAGSVELGPPGELQTFGIHISLR
jgi:hypothetical protein